MYIFLIRGIAFITRLDCIFAETRSKDATLAVLSGGFKHWNRLRFFFIHCLVLHVVFLPTFVGERK